MGPRMVSEGGHTMTSRSSLALGCFVAAGAWPWLVGALAGALMSPLEQATQNAWCGMPHQGVVFLGHCAACWVGSAILVATAGLLFWSDNPLRVAVRQNVFFDRRPRWPRF